MSEYAKLVTGKFQRMQPTGHEPGAGLVLQGTGMSIHVEDSVFRGGVNDRGHCIAIDDGGYKEVYDANWKPTGEWRPGHYDSESGKSSPGAAANGHVVIRHCAIVGGPGPQHYGTLVTCQALGRWVEGGQPSWYDAPSYAALSVSITGCTILGEREYVRLRDIAPDGGILVRGNNRPRAVEEAQHRGIYTTSEAELHAVGVGSGWPMSSDFTHDPTGKLA